MFADAAAEGDNEAVLQLAASIGSLINDVGADVDGTKATR